MELTKHMKAKKRLIDRVEEEIMAEWCKPFPIVMMKPLYRFTSWHKAIERVRRFEGISRQP